MHWGDDELDFEDTDGELNNSDVSADLLLEKQSILVLAAADWHVNVGCPEDVWALPLLIAGASWSHGISDGGSGGLGWGVGSPFEAQ